MIKYFVLLILISSNTYSQVSRNFNKKLSPLYELGIGAGYLNVPNYPGAKNNTFYFIPFPFVIYRGTKLRADEDGTRARIWAEKSFEIGFSGGFNFPLKASQNEIRRGMPDKDALLGLGPSFMFKVVRNKNHKLTTGVGLRSNLMVSSFTEYGFLVEPFVRYWFRVADNFTLFSGASYSWATQKYHSFFYDVEKKYINVNRREFKSSDGTVDLTMSLGFTWNISRNLSLYSGVVYSNLSVSSSKESDLLENEHTVGYGIGFTWPIYESDILVR